MFNLPKHLKRAVWILLFSLIVPVALFFVSSLTNPPISASYNFSFWPNFRAPTPWPIPTPRVRPVVPPVTTPLPQETIKPTASPTLITPPKVSPSLKPQASLTSKDYLMNQINQFRASKGLSPVETDSYSCNFAKIRAQEITSTFNHDGFNSRISSHSLPYPSYHFVTENIAMTQDYKQVETMWANSPGHNANMSADTPYVCVEQSGNYFAYEGWKP